MTPAKRIMCFFCTLFGHHLHTSCGSSAFVCVCVGKVKEHLGLFVTLQFKGLVVHRTSYFVAVGLVYHELLSVKAAFAKGDGGVLVKQ